MWNIICNLSNFFPFSKNVHYHMQFLKFLSLYQKHVLSYSFMEFPYFPNERGLSYVISGISISFQKRVLSYVISEFFLLSNKYVDYHMQFLVFLSLLQ